MTTKERSVGKYLVPVLVVFLFPVAPIFMVSTFEYVIPRCEQFIATETQQCVEQSFGGSYCYEYETKDKAVCIDQDKSYWTFMGKKISN